MPRRAGESDRTEIPSTIMRSDTHARHLWKKAHDSAVGTYGEGGRAHRVAFAALKHEYAKQGDHWVRKAHKGPSDPQAARGPTTRRKSTAEPRAPTAGGKVAKTESEARDKARQARSEYARTRRKTGASKSAH
jgi:cation transport regulator ChaB